MTVPCYIRVMYMTALGENDMILGKVPLSNTNFVDVAPFSFETDKTGALGHAPGYTARGGRRRRQRRTRSKRALKKRKRCSICKGWL